ncbi:hypothetical protein [Algivirga pacifica]|uniref:WD40-like Beta Propeller Repeat n=1 Tax=Algivirga pacifica TaxID=1162670 RepID=A0ABP9DDA8_9BACT
MNLKRLILLLLCYVCNFWSLQAQSLQQTEIQQLIDRQEYRQAYLKLSEEESKSIASPLRYYWTGVCFFHADAFRYKAQFYFDYCKPDAGQLPSLYYYYQARLSHLKEDFLKAINYYNEYLEASAGQGKIGFKEISRQIKMCEYGLKLTTKKTSSIQVSALPVPVNSSYDERHPVLYRSSQEVLYASARRKNQVEYILDESMPFWSDTQKSEGSNIYFTKRKDTQWGYPFLQKLMKDGEYSYPLYLSSDGKQMLLYVASNSQNKRGIYEVFNHKGKWGKPYRLPEVINSSYQEDMGACLALNGQVIYFASNRPGGYGGYDLYKAYRVGEREWSTPQNVGPQINGIADETYPFLVSDNKTMYFSSDREGSMGGRDIFVIEKEGASWGEEKNLGFPINSAGNDDQYTLIRGQKTALWASDRLRSGHIGGFDIYTSFTPSKRIKRAMVSGEILLKKYEKNVPVTLKVTDNLNQSYEHYIYNPDIVTGKFFMILMPKRNYTIQFFAEGKEIQTTKINLPEGLFHYELIQHFSIQPVDLLGMTVGAMVKQDSVSYQTLMLDDIQGKSIDDIRYDGLLQLMEEIVERVDKEGFMSLNQLDELVIKEEPEEEGPDSYYTPLIDVISQAFHEMAPDKLLTLHKLGGEKQEQLMVDHQLKRWKYDLLFEKGSTSLSDSQKEYLQQLAKFSKEHLLMLEFSWLKNSKRFDGDNRKRVANIEAYLSSLDLPDYQYRAAPVMVEGPVEDQATVTVKLIQIATN